MDIFGSFNPGSRNFSGHTAGMGVNNADPKLVDQVNGGYLIDKSGSLTHDQVYGDGDHWTKVAFYMKLNSEPVTADGVFKQWMMKS